MPEDEPRLRATIQPLEGVQGEHGWVVAYVATGTYRPAAERFFNTITAARAWVENEARIFRAPIEWA